MRSLSVVYPAFEDSVNFYAVGFDESLDILAANQAGTGHPGEVATPGGSMIADFRVASQSTKVAVAANGIITYRARFGDGDLDEWQRVFEELVAAN